MRAVAHIDMDAFFAACEERYNPQFRGRPIAVGADPKGGKGRGVISTANYAARKYGIRSALPITKAWQFAEEARKRGEPEVIFLEGNFRLYCEISKRIMAILANGAGAFEQASVDEAYIEWNIEGDDPWQEAEKRGRKLQTEIFKKEGLTASVGVGPNKLVAKIASDFQKPNGLTLVKPENVESFLSPLSIRKIPGIGPKTEIALHRKNIQTVGDLQRADREWLVATFGKWGEGLWRHAYGISESEVSGNWIPKSISEEETFEKDTLQASFILERLHALAEYVVVRMKREGFNAFRTAAIKVRYSDFATMTRAHTAKTPLKTAEHLKGEVLRLLLPFLDARENPRKKNIRLIGVKIEKLE